jgi:hypothetical protein
MATPWQQLPLGAGSANAEAIPVDAVEEQPITPHAVPVFDAEGHLSYIGDDGRRYVVGPLPELDAAHVDQVMQRLLAGQELFADLEKLAERWLSHVCGPDLSRAAALSLLLSSLEMALGPADEPSTD